MRLYRFGRFVLATKCGDQMDCFHHCGQATSLQYWQTASIIWLEATTRIMPAQVASPQLRFVMSLIRSAASRCSVIHSIMLCCGEATPTQQCKQEVLHAATHSADHGTCHSTCTCHCCCCCCLTTPVIMPCKQPATTWLLARPMKQLQSTQPDPQCLMWTIIMLSHLQTSAGSPSHALLLTITTPRPHLIRAVSNAQCAGTRPQVAQHHILAHPGPTVDLHKEAVVAASGPATNNSQLTSLISGHCLHTMTTQHPGNSTETGQQLHQGMQQVYGCTTSSASQSPGWLRQ